jgi:hypothetical protein
VTRTVVRGLGRLECQWTVLEALEYSPFTYRVSETVSPILRLRPVLALVWHIGPVGRGVYSPHAISARLAGGSISRWIAWSGCTSEQWLN